MRDAPCFFFECACVRHPRTQFVRLRWGLLARLRSGGSSDSLKYTWEAVSYTHLTLPTICSV
eukprot:9006531-Alexandrium_andersonii.AAC.1